MPLCRHDLPVPMPPERRLWRQSISAESGPSIIPRSRRRSKCGRSRRTSKTLRQDVLEEDATHELVAVEASRAVVRQHADLQCLWRIVEPNDAGLCDGDAE